MLIKKAFFPLLHFLRRSHPLRNLRVALLFCFLCSALNTFFDRLQQQQQQQGGTRLRRVGRRRQEGFSFHRGEEDEEVPRRQIKPRLERRVRHLENNLRNLEGGGEPNSGRRSRDSNGDEVEGWPRGKSLDAKRYILHTEDNSIIKPVLRASDRRDSAVLIGVQSGPLNSGNRREIRETWGKTCRENGGCHYFFSIGQSSSEEASSQVRSEAREFGDILQDPFQDSYNNLTVKTLYMIRHFRISNPSFNYFLKTDDDSFIFVERLQKLIIASSSSSSKLASDSGVSMLLMGQLMLGSDSEVRISSAVAKSFPPAHKLYAKMPARLRAWAIPKYMYKGRKFPPFLSGSGYLMGRSAADCLLDASQTVPLIFLEDVYTTGLLAEKCNIIRYHHDGFVHKTKNKHVQAWYVMLHYSKGKMKHYHEISRKNN